MKEEMKKTVEDLRALLLNTHTQEELQALKLKIDALEGLRRLSDGSDHDVDEGNQHHHDHT